MKDQKEKQETIEAPRLPEQPATTSTAGTTPAKAAPASPREGETNSAFSRLASEVGDSVCGRSFDDLSESGKDAVRAFASLPADDPRHESAKRAALDAIRDHQRAGWPATTQNKVAESDDPNVRNVAPTGTRGETSGMPTTANTPPAPEPAKK